MLRGLCLGIAVCCSFRIAAANIAGISPPEGFPWGGNAVEIESAIPLVDTTVHCDDAAACGPCPATVFFGGVPARVVMIKRLTISVIVPPHAPGLVDVSAHMSGLPELEAADAFLYTSTIVAPSTDYARMLVPLTAYDLHGANGSLWRSELTVLNDSDHSVTLVPEATYAPHRTAQVRLESRAGGLDGAFVYVPRDLGERFAMQLRARDVSSEAEGWGTEVPVVHEDQFAQVVHLLDVPTDPRYRATLRIYGDPALTHAQVTVFDDDGPIDDRVVALQPGDSDSRGFNENPPYAQLDPLTPAVRAASAGQPVRIRIIAMPPEEGDFVGLPRTWAFASITNNETQQVTTVTPQRRNAQ